MTHTFKLALLLSALVAVGCKSDDDTDTTTGNLKGGLGKANRPETNAADRIDRAGRPAITAALISTFDPANAETQHDLYNKSGNANPDFLPTIEQSLAILDGLDQKCGNQLLAGAAPGQKIYQPLATALNDDQLYVQSDRVGVKPYYLGVEAEATGALPPGTGFGGGRYPGEDVIERSYSVLAAGVLSGIDDGVPTDDAEHDIDVFPFIAAPQQQ